MKRRPVTSSAIKSLAFRNEVLEVEYQSGAVYRMEGVTREQYAAMKKKGASIGQHVNALKAFCTAVTKVEPKPGQEHT